MSMKANVMIGDWMRHANGECYQVRRIDGFSDGTINFACGSPHLWDYNNKFEPIPLTKEILEENGFEKVIRKTVAGDYTVWEWRWSDDGSMDEDFQNYVGIWYDLSHNINLEIRLAMSDGGSLCIDYVHELQQALRLYGIDKEIIIK